MRESENGNGNGRGTLSLERARELTPPVNAVEAMRRQLAVALFGGVKEQDVLDVAMKLKEMALSGDHKAMQMFFKLMLPDGKQPPAPPQDGAGLRMMAEALGELMGEIRAAKARPAAALADSPRDDAVRAARVLTGLAAQGRQTTFERLQNHLREDGLDCTRQEYEAAWQQLFGGTDEAGRRLKPPSGGRGEGG